MGYVLGLDLGTGALKGVLVDETGVIRHIEACDYPFIAQKGAIMNKIPLIGSQPVVHCSKNFLAMSLISRLN